MNVGKKRCLGCKEETEIENKRKKSKNVRKKKLEPEKAKEKKGKETVRKEEQRVESKEGNVFFLLLIKWINTWNLKRSKEHELERKKDDVKKKKKKNKINDD